MTVRALVGPACAWLVVLGVGCGGEPAEAPKPAAKSVQEPEAELEPEPEPEPGPEPEPEVAPKPEPDPEPDPHPDRPGVTTVGGIDAIVADLATARGGRLISSSQCWAEAEWAKADLVGGGYALKAGELLHVLDAEGVTDRAAMPEKHRCLLEGAASGNPVDLQLTTRNQAIATTARLEHRWLSPPGRDAKRIAAWARKQRRRPFVPEGEIRGTFGGGIDRLVVVSPIVRPYDPDANDNDLAGEVVVLVAGSKPVGVLPLDVEVAAGAYGDAWTYGLNGLQVAGVADLDGNGSEEVVWVAQPTTPGLETKLLVSYFDSGQHRTHDVVSCTYNGCEKFIAAEKCRGFVKYR